VTLEVWDGNGLQPQWLREALIKEGYTVNELRPVAMPEVSTEATSVS
jgi:DNA-binding protein H-NS